MFGRRLVAVALFTREVNEHREARRALDDRANGGAFEANE